MGSLLYQTSAAVWGPLASTAGGATGTGTLGAVGASAADWLAGADAVADAGLTASRPEADSPLQKALLDGDQAALVMAMRDAAREAGLPDIQFFTQRSAYALRILDRMGLPALDVRLQAMQSSGAPGSASVRAASALRASST